VDRSLTIDLLGWLAWPARDGVAERQWRSAQWQAAVAAVGQGLAARQAWVDAVAAQQQWVCSSACRRWPTPPPSWPRPWPRPATCRR
jgi:hypothetical protein